MRMPLKLRIEFAKKRHIFLRTKSRKCKSKVKTGRLVASRPDNSVAVRPVRILGIVIGDAKVERGGDIHDGKSAAGMSGSCRTQRGEVITAHQVRLLFQFVDAVRTENFAGVRILNRHGVAPWRAPGLGRQSGPGGKPRI